MTFKCERIKLKHNFVNQPLPSLFNLSFHHTPPPACCPIYRPALCSYFLASCYLPHGLFCPSYLWLCQSERHLALLFKMYAVSTFIVRVCVCVCCVLFAVCCVLCMCVNLCVLCVISCASICTFVWICVVHLCLCVHVCTFEF